MNDAEALAGAELKVPAGGAGALPEGTFYHYDLVGCEVRDTAGRAIGAVTAVEGTMERSRLVVAGSRGEVLIPLVADDLRARSTWPARRIVVEPAGGLVDLTSKLNERARGRRGEDRHRHHLSEDGARRRSRKGSSGGPSNAGCSTCGCTTCAITRPTGTGSWTTCRLAAGRGWC